MKQKPAVVQKHLSSDEYNTFELYIVIGIFRESHQLLKAKSAISIHH